MNPIPKISQNVFACLILLAIMAIALFLTRPSSFQIRWNDETLYYTVAQNIARNFDFNSHHYLASSIIQKGYPTKDTHLPGYPLLLALGFSLGGINETTPFFVNYFLLALTLILIFALGTKITNLWVGFFAGIIYLISPYTLVLTHSIMTEISASAAVIIVVALLFLQRESWLKGVFLAFAISMSYLIKPFLLALLPATILALLFQKSPGYRKTLLSLFFAFAFLSAVALLPLSQNQEIYPYSATAILSAPSLSAKIELMARQFWLNCGLLANFWDFPVYASISLSMLFLWGIPGAVLVKRICGDRSFSSSSLFKENSAFYSLTIFSFLSFIPVFLAIFLLYQYIDMGIRGLASFSALLSLLCATGFGELFGKKVEEVNGWRVVVWGLVICWCLGCANLATFSKLKNLQRRQSARLYTASSRVEKVIYESGLQPGMVISEKNFYLAIANYPTQVIWQLPQSLSDFREVEKRVAIDLIELTENYPLFQENLKVYGNINYLDGRYRLGYREKEFYYYFNMNL